LSILSDEISRNSEGEMTNGERLTKFLKLRKSGILQLVIGRNEGSICRLYRSFTPFRM